MVWFTSLIVFTIVAFALVLPAVKRRWWPEHKLAFALVLGCVLVVESALAYVVIVRPTLEEGAVLRSGLTAEADILAARPTGNTFNHNPEVELTLRIRPLNAPPYVTKTTLVIHVPDVPKYTAGKQVTVRLDPDDRDNFLIRGLNAP